MIYSSGLHSIDISKGNQFEDGGHEKSRKLTQMGLYVVVPWVSCSDRHHCEELSDVSLGTSQQVDEGFSLKPQSCIQQDLDCSGFGLC